MQADLLSNAAVRANWRGSIRTPVFANASRKLMRESLLDRLLYADIKTYLHELLMKQDQMSMATSVESRVPFLDHKLVEFTCSLPERLKLRGGTTKYILRESMKDVLPEAILSRSKMGFPVPIAAWFRGAYRSVIDEYVLSERAMSRGIIQSRLRARPRESTSVRRLKITTSDLWALVNFEIWQRQFFDGEAQHDVSPLLAEVAV